MFILSDTNPSQNIVIDSGEGGAWASGGYPDHVHRLCQRGGFQRFGNRVNNLGDNGLMGFLGWPSCVVGGKNMAQGSLDLKTSE